MILIASGAYLGAEFYPELGRLPPSMSPIGNKPLYFYQVAELKLNFPDEPIWLTVPSGYQLMRSDEEGMKKLGITLLRVPEMLSLAESLLYAINCIGEYDRPLRVLHGDTLISGFPSKTNVIGVSDTQDLYNWEVEKVEDDKEVVWCGYFSFGNIRELARCLAAAQGNFVHAVREYMDNDRGRREYVGCWHDLGHVSTYFKARSGYTTERVFNSLRINSGTVIKEGGIGDKLRRESNWFEMLPTELVVYTPQLIRTWGEGYELEYLCMLPLNEMFLYGRNPSFFWKKIFDCFSGWFKLSSLAVNSQEFSSFAADSEYLYRDKTIARLDEFFQSGSAGMGIDFDSCIKLNEWESVDVRTVVMTCIDKALSLDQTQGLFHGDLCFSNVLFDSRSDRIKLIDPRGCNTRRELRGDINYDLAKLSHSVVGLYDYIVAGHYSLHETGNGEYRFEIFADERVSTIQKTFLNMQFPLNIRVSDVSSVVCLLFFSMLPLHADCEQRQKALFLNAIRLFFEGVEDK